MNTSKPKSCKRRKRNPQPKTSKRRKQNLETEFEERVTGGLKVCSIRAILLYFLGKW